MHAPSHSHVWLFVTPWNVAHQAPLSMGFSRQEYWTGLPCTSPSDLTDPGIEPMSPVSWIGGQIIYNWATWEWFTKCFHIHCLSYYYLHNSFRMDLLVWYPWSPRDSKESSATSQFKSINSLVSQPSLRYNSHIHTWLLEKP